MSKESPLVIFKQKRVFLSADDRLKQIAFWRYGTTATLWLTIGCAILGAMVFISNPALLSTPLALFYIFFYVFAGLGGFIAIQPTGQVRSVSFINGIVGAFIGFGIMVVASWGFQFISTLQLLEAADPGVPISVFEHLIFQMTFVAVSEELVFRHTLPWLFEQLLSLKLSIETARKISLLVLSAFLFSIMHIITYEFAFWPLMNALTAGVILGWIRMGLIRKKDDRIEEIDGQQVRVPRYWFGGLFGCVIAHLIYNALVISKLNLIFP
jgi:hypothetical protein